MNDIEDAEIVGRTVAVRFTNKKVLSYEDVWLRDNCRCSTCYHADKYQRALHILYIPDSQVTNLRNSRSEILITWDDGHESKYSADFLADFDYVSWKERGRFTPILWHGADVANKVARVHANDFMTSPEALRSVFKSLLDYGVAFIEGVGVSEDATEEVCKTLGGVQHTLFGGMWTFSTYPDHADTAFTNLPLAVHNDNTYFTEAAGLQILHCLEHSGGTGGETILVDGFDGATRLKEEFHEAYAFLSTFNVEAQYIEEGHYHKYSAPVIQIDNESKEIKQIRFNAYDRATMAFASGDLCRQYYRSLKQLSRYYEDTSNQWQFKLTPGTILVFDNFRLLHGRTGFSGKRVLCGCYVSRSDWLDRARWLRLIA